MFFKKTLSHQAILKGTPEEYFLTISNVSKWYIWSPNVLHSSLDGVFEKGAVGIVMPKEYTHMKLIVSEVKANRFLEFTLRRPLGYLKVSYEFYLVRENETHITRKSEMFGIVALINYLIRSKTITKDFDRTLTSLEQQVNSSSEKIAAQKAKMRA
jgi:hypothetical protein